MVKLQFSSRVGCDLPTYLPYLTVNENNLHYLVYRKLVRSGDFLSVVGFNPSPTADRESLTCCDISHRHFFGKIKNLHGTHHTLDFTVSISDSSSSLLPFSSCHQLNDMGETIGHESVLNVNIGILGEFFFGLFCRVLSSIP